MNKISIPAPRLSIVMAGSLTTPTTQLIADFAADTVKRLEETEKRCDRWRKCSESFKRNAHHSFQCDVYLNPSQPCDCALGAALEMFNELIK
jgi:hypothetical protein